MDRPPEQSGGLSFLHPQVVQLVFQVVCERKIAFPRRICVGHRSMEQDSRICRENDLLCGFASEAHRNKNGFTDLSKKTLYFQKMSSRILLRWSHMLNKTSL